MLPKVGIRVFVSFDTQTAITKTVSSADVMKPRSPWEDDNERREIASYFRRLLFLKPRVYRDIRLERLKTIPVRDLNQVHP